MKKIIFFLTLMISTISSNAQTCSGGSLTGTVNGCNLSITKTATINLLAVDSILSGAKFYGNYFGPVIGEQYGGTGSSSMTTALALATNITHPSDTFTYIMSVKRASDSIVSLNNKINLKLSSESDPLFNTKFASKTTDDLNVGSNNLYFTNTLARTAFSNGTGISISSGVITNSSPDQIITLTAGQGESITGIYPNFTISKTKRQEPYSGVTNVNGLYTVTYSTAYSVTPNVQFQINGGNNKQTILLTSSTASGFTCYVQLRSDVLGLLPTYSNVNGQAVEVLVTEK